MSTQPTTLTLTTWMYKPEPDPGLYVQVITMELYPDTQQRKVMLADGREIVVKEGLCLDTKGDIDTTARREA